MSNPIDIPGNQNPQQVIIDYTMPNGGNFQATFWEDDNHSVTANHLINEVEAVHQVQDAQVWLNGNQLNPEDDIFAGQQYQIGVPAAAGQQAGDEEVFQMDV